MRLQDFRLIAAPFTPMHADGSLNLAVVGAQAEHLIASGVRGVFVGGTSGEGQSLTVDERMSLTEAWTGAHRSNLEVFVHVGHNCQDDAIRLARHARAVQADAIALHAPTWFKQQSLSELIDFCIPVAGAAPSLPFYLYDMPKITGVRLSSAAFLVSAKQVIPTLAGIKYTNPDCITVQECIQLDGGTYDVLWGCDETLLAGIALGASGAVGSTYNFAAPIYLRILDAVESDDWQTARAEQARSV
ncbi:MAG: dihydrodipicolinate synthase family protein, partial [Pirellulales bacterium]